MNVHESFKYLMKTVLPTETFDCTKLGDKHRIRFIQPVGVLAKINAREYNNSDSDKSAYSTTGLYTGADAQCADCDGKSVYNFDKIYVATGSAPIRIGIVFDEVI